METKDRALVQHFIIINNSRNKKESFAEQYDSASEDEKDRLMSADRVDGLSTQDREQAIAPPPPPKEKDSDPFKHIKEIQAAFKKREQKTGVGGRNIGGR